MKSTHYYKFFNKTECHYLVQYKTGLNIDPIPFNTNPTYECGKGGLYFSDATNIMNFIDLGMAYIREVEVPEEYEIVYISDKTKYRAHALNLLKKHKLSDVKTWQWMLDQKIDITADNYAIRWASRNGQLSVVKFLVKYDAKTALDNYAIKMASRYGHLSVVKFLVEHGADVTVDDNRAIRWASENGHLSVVKFLVKHGADATDEDNRAITWASENGHTEVVEYLKSKGATLWVSRGR